MLKTNLMMKNKNKMQKSTWKPKIDFFYFELATLTCAVTCSKL